MEPTAEPGIEEDAPADGGGVDLERVARLLLCAIYAADLVFCVDLLTDRAIRRWVAARWAKLSAARRRRVEFERSRARMLFELAVIEEEAQ